MTRIRLRGSPLAALLLSLMLAGVGATACARSAGPGPAPRTYYDTGFPTGHATPALERILESVKRITVTTVYETYLFPEEEAPSSLEAPTEAMLARARDTVSALQARSATAVVLSRTGRRALLLTADHAVHRPDTVFQYYDREGPAGRPAGVPRRVRSVTILERRSDWVVGDRSMDPFRVLARDEGNDLALLGVERSPGDGPDAFPLLPVRTGDPDRLSWGSFVYVLGYPGGYPMVTRGIVSDPGREVTRAFIIDGLWNEGMSGGLVLGVRAGRQELEWLGMARSSSAATERRLVPDEGAARTHDRWRPYDGPLYLEEVRRIQYGITMAVPMDDIRRFTERHREELRAAGYAVPEL